MKRIPPPPKNDLEQMYFVDKKSSCCIADKYNCSNTTVLTWLRMYKIPVRAHCKKWDAPSKEIMEELYIDSQLSTSKIGEIYGVSFKTILRLLRHYEIEVKRVHRPTKTELEQLYLTDGVSSSEIGEMYGVSFNTVLNWLRYHKTEVRHRGVTPVMIKTKKQQMAHDRGRTVCNTLKKHADDLKDDPERLSTEFMQNLIGVECK